MHKLRQEILFLQLEDSNYMLGKIEAMQTVTYAKLTFGELIYAWKVGLSGETWIFFQV